MTRPCQPLTAGLTTLVLLLAASCTGDNAVRITAADGADRASGRSIVLKLAVNAALKTAADQAKTAADIHHITVTLYPYTTPAGPMGGTPVATHVTGNGAVTSVRFNNVPIGSYKVTAEAFSSTDDSVTITKIPVPTSANYATISNGSSVTSYSSPDSTQLVVTIPLQDGTGERVKVDYQPKDGWKTGNLAPDDSGDAAAVHDYTVTKNGVTSTFVWIPRFTAIQLINPLVCGGRMRFGVADNARRAGYWVDPLLGPPLGGAPNVDWVSEVFGGIYVGKYEASQDDATAGDTGGSGRLAVRQNVAPWNLVDWITAANACLQYDPHCHLTTDEEWATLAIAAQIRNITVHGGNLPAHQSGDDPNIQFVPLDPPLAGSPWSQTGSGFLHASGGGPWPPGINLTTHTGGTDGVYDLNGNLAEWTASVGLPNPVVNWTINDADSNVAVPAAQGSVDNLSTAPWVRRQGLPSACGGGFFDFGQDVITWVAAAVPRVANRGGDMNLGPASGLWAINLSFDDSTPSPHIGFRPALRF